VQRTQNTDNDTTDSKSDGRVGVSDQDERGYNSSYTRPDGSPSYKEAPHRSAVDEARQMLDEIAGLDHAYPGGRKARPDTARTVRTILLWPFIVIWAFLKLIFVPLRRADFKLLAEMRKFLQHPGHFFWFNRIAPEAAARHFGTTSTDAMTHHARRYGAHTAMLILAGVVVVFGGFSGLATKIASTYADVVNPPMIDGQMMIIGDSREIYVSAIAANSANFPRRIETIVAKDGQTLRSIAADRNLSLATLLYANNLVDPESEVKAGQKIVVPPVTGMLHITNNGDTVGKIADIYGVDPKVILTYKFNNLENADASTVLKPLTEVMVPGGSMPPRSSLYMYTVKPADSLKTVADRFGLKVDTLLDNNDLDDGLHPGQQIRILPVDGVIYKVKQGDTLDGVASYLGTSPQNIIDFKTNNVARGVSLQVGSSIIVPNGTWPPPPPPPPAVVVTPPPAKPASNAPASNNSGKAAPAVAPLPQKASNTNTTKNSAPAVQKPAANTAAKPAQQVAVPNAGRATGSMVWPIRGVITTYFHQPIWYGIHEGLDIATTCGTPTVAADGGTVVEAGWNNGGYGNMVLIDHGGGIRTRYGHFMAVKVSVGQRVAKGQLIGLEGTTGNSTGCHVHFEVIVSGRTTDPLRWLK